MKMLPLLAGKICINWFAEDVAKVIEQRNQPFPTFSIDAVDPVVGPNCVTAPEVPANKLKIHDAPEENPLVTTSNLRPKAESGLA